MTCLGRAFLSIGAATAVLGRVGPVAEERFADPEICKFEDQIVCLAMDWGTPPEQLVDLLSDRVDSYLNYVRRTYPVGTQERSDQLDRLVKHDLAMVRQCARTLAWSEGTFQDRRIALESVLRELVSERSPACFLDGIGANYINPYSGRLAFSEFSDLIESQLASEGDSARRDVLFEILCDERLLPDSLRAAVRLYPVVSVDEQVYLTWLVNGSDAGVPLRSAAYEATQLDQKRAALALLPASEHEEDLCEDLRLIAHVLSASLGGSWSDRKLAYDVADQVLQRNSNKWDRVSYTAHMVPSAIAAFSTALIDDLNAQDGVMAGRALSTLKIAADRMPVYCAARCGALSALIFAARNTKDLKRKAQLVMEFPYLLATIGKVKWLPRTVCVSSNEIAVALHALPESEASFAMESLRGFVSADEAFVDLIAISPDWRKRLKAATLINPLCVDEYHASALRRAAHVETDPDAKQALDGCVDRLPVGLMEVESLGL